MAVGNVDQRVDLCRRLALASARGVSMLQRILDRNLPVQWTSVAVGHHLAQRRLVLLRTLPTLVVGGGRLVVQRILHPRRRSIVLAEGGDVPVGLSAGFDVPTSS